MPRTKMSFIVNICLPNKGLSISPPYLMVRCTTINNNSKQLLASPFFGSVEISTSGESWCKGLTYKQLNNDKKMLCFSKSNCSNFAVHLYYYYSVLVGNLFLSSNHITWNSVALTFIIIIGNIQSISNNLYLLKYNGYNLEKLCQPLFAQCDFCQIE